jgi:hypothetical protein
MSIRCSQNGRRIKTPKPATPDPIVAALIGFSQQLSQFDRVSIGTPGSGTGDVVLTSSKTVLQKETPRSNERECFASRLVLSDTKGAGASGHYLPRKHNRVKSFSAHAGNASFSTAPAHRRRWHSIETHKKMSREGWCDLSRAHEGRRYSTRERFGWSGHNNTQRGPLRRYPTRN